MVSLSGPSTSRGVTDLLPDMLDNYRRPKGPQPRNNKRKTRQTKSQEPKIQRKTRKKKVAISPPLIDGLSVSESEDVDNPPTPTKNKNRNRSPVVSDNESERSLPSPPFTRKKTLGLSKQRKKTTKKYASSQPLLHVTREEEFQSSHLSAIAEGSPKLDDCQELNDIASVLADKH